MKKSIKILLILIITFTSFVVTSKVEAASATISATKKTATVGDNVSVNISFNAAAWNLHVSGTGVSSSSYADTTNNGKNAKTTKSLKVDTSSAGTKTIKLTGDVTDGTTGKTTNINKSVTITINKASSNGNNNNNNSNNNNTNNNNNNPTNNNSNSTTEPTFTTVNETVYAKSKANVRSSYSTSSSIVGSLKVGDSITRTGISNNGWSKITYNGQTAYVSSSLITKTKPEEPNETDKPSETQTPDNSSDKKDDLKLDSLKIKDYELKPEFSKDIYEYELNVENEVKKLELEAISENKDDIIEITGNENLKVGENIITITIYKDKSKEKTVYTIKAIKEDTKQEQTETIVTINQDGLNEEIDRINSKLKVREWIIRGIIIFVTVLIIIMIILRYLTVKKEDAQDFNYVNIRDKFNEFEDVDNNEEQQVEEQEEADEKNYNIAEEVQEDIQDDNDIGYRFKRSKKTKGKH